MAPRLISSGSSLEERYGYSRAVVTGNHVHVAGTAPIMPDDADPPPDPFGQTHRCLAIALAAMEQVGASAADVVRTRIMLTRAEDFPEIARAHGEVFRNGRPVNTSYVVAALLDPRWLLEIELEAVVE